MHDRFSPRAVRLALPSLLLLLVLSALPAASAAETPLDRMTRVKQLQREILVRKARRTIRAAQLRAETGRIPAADRFAVHRGRPVRDESLPAAPRGHFARPEGGPGIATDVRANDPAGDDADASQNEPSIGAWGDYVLVAYNDLPGFGFGGSLQGFAYSTDGGATFVDGGEVPAPDDTSLWTSDPVIAVNEKTGDFYYCGLFETPQFGGVGMVRGSFSGSTFTWDEPTIVRSTDATQHFLDKCWIAADSLTDQVYVTYTDFTLSESSIEFHYSPFRGVSWIGPIRMSTLQASDLVQGSRPVVGPDGEIYVTWKEIGPEEPGYDFIRIRKSVDLGASFGPEQTAATFFDNFGTGAPGFNRERGVALPAIAVDRTRGPHRGRVYVAWNEALNWYDDAPVVDVIRDEVESNEWFASATPFTIGETLAGAFTDALEFDYFSFTAVAGESYVFWADAVPNSQYSLRVFCADTLTNLAFTGHFGEIDNEGNQSLMVWTCARDGTYYLRLANIEELVDAGPWRVRTGVARPGPGDRGRDQRDAFVAWSDDGVLWSWPQRVNDDPPLTDNWLPEVAVSAFGTVHLLWYDWRSSLPECGGSSQTWLANSDDGGVSWNVLGPVSNADTRWALVESNMLPNQGDYLGLFANDRGVYAAWTDGRTAQPDIWTAVVTALPESLQVAASVEARLGAVTVSWDFRLDRVVGFTLYRQVGDGARESFGPRTTDAAGRFAFEDTDVAGGTRYTYSLGVPFQGGEVEVGTVSPLIPSGRLAVRPNPLVRLTTIEYDVLPPGGRIELAVFDLSGRKVRTLLQEVQPAGPRQAVWDGRDDDGRGLYSGIYLLRLSQANGPSVTRRVSLIR